MNAPRDLAQIVDATTSGQTTAVEVVNGYLDAIERHDGDLNAYSVVLATSARAEAAELDRRRAAGEPLGPLHGVPIAIKEEVDVEDCVTTFGGLANSTPRAADGEVVRRLRAAGAVIIGKTRMPEFGAFPYTESESDGVTRNPWNRAHTPGGSSGGSAVAVATGMAAVAIGGDGGGSIRIPSACCGLFGLKPQRGRVTTAPMEHLWFALGTAGPLSRTVLDSAMVYDVIRGSTPQDRFQAGEAESFVAAARREPGRLRIGWSTKPVSVGIRPAEEHIDAVKATAKLLSSLGHAVIEVDPRYPDPTAAFVPQFFAGIRAEADEVEHPDRLERRTKETRRLGAWVTPAVTEWAIRQSMKISVKANRVFDQCDVLLTPAIAHRPPLAGVISGRGTVASALASMPAIAYAALWNVAGNPAASVPVGVGADGMPLAVQLVGRTDDEPTLLSLSAQMEQAQSFPVLQMGA